MEKYFFIADLLGFSNMITNTSPEQRDKRIDSWVQLVKEAKANVNIEKTQLISDTLFASAGSTEGDLLKMINFAQYLLNKGIERSLPIRGAICFGEYVWGELTYGKAVIKAHQLESKQNWIGVICDNNIPNIDTYSGTLLTCYPPPLKNSNFELYYVVNWDVPEFSKLIGLMVREGLTKTGEQISCDILDKINNTVEFSLYRKLINKHEISASKFVGYSPINTIECMVDNK